MTDQLYERSNEARLTRMLMESNQNTHAAVSRAIDLLAEREREMARLSRECEQAGDKVLEQRAEIERLQARNHHLRGLLETAADAWECGQAVTNRQGVVLADFRGACLSKAWWEAAKAGGDDE